MWAVVRPLQEEHPRPYTYDEWNRVMTVTYLLFLGAAAGVWQVLAPHVRRVGRAGLVLSMVGCSLLIAGNVVEFWLSWMLNVPTAFDSGYSGGGWSGSYWGWGIFMLGCFVLVGAAALLAVGFIRARAVLWWLAAPAVLAQLFLPAFFAPRHAVVFGVVWVWLGLALAGWGRSRAAVGR